MVVIMKSYGIIRVHGWMIAAEFVVLVILLTTYGANATTIVWDESSGSPLPFTWNYSNFDDFSKNGSGTENLSVIRIGLGEKNRTIPGRNGLSAGGLKYDTSIKMIEYEVSKNEGAAVYNALDKDGNKAYQGNYYALEKLFGESYIALNGKSNILTNLIFEQKDNQSKILYVGETWNMGDGWALKLNAIDTRTSPRQAWFSLKKDGGIMDEGISAEKTVYTKTKSIDGQIDVPIFVTYIENIFSGSTSDFIVLKHTWLISNDYLELFNRNFGNLILTYNMSYKSVFENNESIVLSPNSSINLAGNLNLKVIDNVSYLKFYPAFSPKLDITASKERIEAGNATDVVFTVKEKGSAVSGAVLKLKGAAVGNGSTDINGKLAMDINASYKGTIIVEATKEGYSKGTATLQTYQAPLAAKASWEVEENYSLNLIDIGTKTFPMHARLQFIKNGMVLKDSVVETGEVFKYCQSNCIFNATIESIFNGRQGFFIKLINVSQYSESDGSKLPVNVVHVFRSQDFTRVNWKLDEGYELNWMDIDVKNPHSAYLELLKNNVTLDEFILSQGQSYLYNDSTKILEILVDSVLAGEQGDILSLTNVNQYSETDGIRLRNNESHIYKSMNFTGITWNLEEGYELRRMDLDVSTQPHMVWLELLKNNTVLDDAFIFNGQRYYFNDSSDSMILTARIEAIFKGTKSSFVKIVEVDQFSDTSGEVLLKNASYIYINGSVDWNAIQYPEKIITTRVIIVRGNVANEPDSHYLKPKWDANSFSGFSYDPKFNRGTEEFNLMDDLQTLHSSRRIGEGRMWYNTTGIPIDFKVSENEFVEVGGVTKFKLVGWQGEKWIAIKNDTTKIARLILEMGKQDKKRLRKGDTWSMGAGYELSINDLEVNASPRYVKFTLKKDGNAIDGDKGQIPVEVNEKEVYTKNLTILGEDGALMFTVYVDGIFSGATSQIVQLKYAWLIDASSAQQIKLGDKFDVFRVRSANNDGINLSNEESIPLGKNSNIKLLGNIAFEITDSDDLRFYPNIIYALPGSYEVRGHTSDESSQTDLFWDARSFSPFYYEPKNNRYTEELNFSENFSNLYSKRRIDRGRLWYNTTSAPAEFMVHLKEGIDVGGSPQYREVGWQGEKWIAINNVSSKIAKLALEMGSDDRKTMETGDTWLLGSGYELRINDIETRSSPRQVWFTFKKDGKVIDEVILSEKNIYSKTKTIKNESNALLFTIYVERIFSGSVSNMVQLRYAWLVDEGTAMQIKPDDRFGVFRVRKVNNDGINLSNEDCIDLSKNSEKTIIGDIKIKVADSDILRFYPAVDYIINDWKTATAGHVHNLNKSTNYDTIQASINDAGLGDEIHVENGTYYENVNVTKQLILRGIGIPVVDARQIGSAITLSANGTTLEGFNLKGGSYSGAGIRIMSHNNTLSRNIISNGFIGISLNSSSNNTIYNNIFHNNKNVQIFESNNNTWNIAKRGGTNIIGGPYLGGNFWANPDGTGFSQICRDADKDGICEESNILDSSNIDYMPISMNFTIDLVPLGNVTHLKNISACNYIEWTWKDPENRDFSKVMVYFDGIFKTNVSKGGQYYKAVNLTQNTKHKLSLRTVDSFGNFGKWKNNTARTAHCTVLIVDDDNDPYFADDRSVPTFESSFKSIGYNITIKRSNVISKNSSLGIYDLIVWSDGDDVSAINSIENEEILVNFSIKGGHLIIESGNAARWLQIKENPGLIDNALRNYVFHITSNHVYSETGNLTLASSHPLANTPNVLPKTIGFTPTDPEDEESGDADAVRILTNAVGIYNWSYVKSGGNPINISVARKSYGLVAYDDDTDVSNGGQIVYYAFDIDDIDSSKIRRKLIENSVKWLRG